MGRARAARRALPGGRWRLRLRQDQRLHRPRGTEPGLPGVRVVWSAHTHLALWPIWRAGTLDQKARFFKPGLAGEKIGGFGLSEPDGGSDVRGMKTKASKVAGGWRLNGSKLYITNAPMADFLMVAARTKPEHYGRCHQPVHRRTAEPGLRYQQAEEGRHPLLRNRADPHRGCVRARRLPARRREPAPTASCWNRCRRTASGYRQLSRHGARRVRGVARVRQDADRPRQADHRIPGDRPQARRHGGRHRGGEVAGLLRRLAGRSGHDRRRDASKVKLVASEMAVRVTEQAIRIHGGAGNSRQS